MHFVFHLQFFSLKYDMVKLEGKENKSKEAQNLS